MSRWWRAYDEAVDDPKLIMLSDKAHRAWFCLMCVASANGGVLPDIKVVAIKLRTTAQRAAVILAELVAAGLFDRREDGRFEPHNWGGRQFQSDVSTDRVKRFRKRKETVSVTPPETETETEKIPEADASGEPPPIDHRKRLFSEGLAALARITGKGPDACRSFVGKCLKSAGDDAVIVLGLIEDAERNQTVDPAAWIAARLKAREGTPNGRRTVHDAARDLHQQTIAAVLAFDEPAPRSLRDAASDGPVRLLPSR